MENDITELVRENKRLLKMIKEEREANNINAEKVSYLEKDNWFLKDKLCIENGSRGRCEKCGTVSVVSLGKTYAK